MNENLEALERRTRSVHGIRGVVHTMKTLSAINAAPCEQAARAINGYLDVVLTGLQALLQVSSVAQHPSRSTGSHQLLLALGTDHGLCGNYNELVAEQVATAVAIPASGGTSTTCQIICVGAQLDDALANLGLESEVVLFTPSSVDGLIRLAGDLVAEIDHLAVGLDTSAVHVQMVYTEPAEHGRQNTVTKTLLPLPSDQISTLRTRDWPSRSRPWFRQSEQSLFAAILRNYLFASVCRSAADAMLTENTARLARMRQAEDAVDEQLETLTVRTRSARQSRITEELQDVIAGFEAVQVDSAN